LTEKSAVPYFTCSDRAYNIDYLFIVTFILMIDSLELPTAACLC